MVDISSLKIAMSSPVNLGGVENSTAFISTVQVNGVNLSDATYYPVNGTPVLEILDGHNPDGTGGLSDGGYTIVDATSWNNTLADTPGTARIPLKSMAAAARTLPYMSWRALRYQIAATARARSPLTNIVVSIKMRS